jgi:methionyl-tRNA formyltransferase
MRVAFLGSDEFGAIGLEAVAASVHQVVLVVTVPDRPKGRGRVCEAGPVRCVAEKHGLRTVQPESIKEQTAQEALVGSTPDVIAVVCYGEYIPESVFSAPTFGSINVHPSLLPRWRGASPVHYTLLAGDRMGGVTIQYVAKRMDAGDILLQREVEIGRDENHGELSDRLYRLGGTMLVEALDRLESGTIEARKQDEALATKAPKMQKSDLWLDWGVPAEELRNRVRALAPSPGARARFREEQVKILEMSHDFRPLNEPARPGEVVSVEKERFLVACADRAVEITRIQPPGKRAVSGRDFVNGFHPHTGEFFESAPKGGEI